MTGARLLLACGDEVAYADDKTPTCPVHGAQPVARVLDVPAPRFRGVVTGPHAQTVQLDPFVGSLLPEKDTNA